MSLFIHSLDWLILFLNFLVFVINLFAPLKKERKPETVQERMISTLFVVATIAICLNSLIGRW